MYACVIIMILILVSEFRAAVDWHVINDGNIWFAWLMTRLLTHYRQITPVENVPSASGTSPLDMIDIQATTKSKYYDHIVLLYLESKRCRNRSIIFVCFDLYGTVVNFIDYSDMDKMMDINNDKC